MRDNMNYDEIIKKGLPKHIAIILDGNGRWAKKRLMPRTYGHQAGLENLENISKLCNELGIECLTVYCFSTENWNRPQSEVDFLMKAPIKFFGKKVNGMKNSTTRIKFIGRKDRIPEETLKIFNEVEEETKSHSGMILNIAFDYGAKDELTTATKAICKQVLDGDLSIDDINEDLIENNLFTVDCPKLDLLIRTSGECRISNFLLWQLSYAELYFTDCLWPDFDKEELFKAFESYQGRKRRFGGLNKEEQK